MPRLANHAPQPRALLASRSYYTSLYFRNFTPGTRRSRATAVMDSDTASNVTPYTYEALPDGDFVRLMHLQPALHVHEPVRFTFTVNRIEDLVARYEAISYTWGEPILDHALHIDDACVLVTKNLDKALRRFRLPTTTRTLWADAVCINQRDDQEKSRQIPFMTRLFRFANRVLAWLDGGDEEERGMQVLNSLSRQSLPTLSEPGASLQPTERDAIDKFIGLAWFTRLWIIQEVVMNADVVLMCQSSELSWLRFTIALSIYAKRYEPKTAWAEPDKLEELSHVIKLWKYHNMTTEEVVAPNPSDLTGWVNKWLPVTRLGNDNDMMFDRPAKIPGTEIMELVDKFSSYGCTDARDRIFALYNVATNIRATALREHKESPMSFSVSPFEGKDVIYMDVDYSMNIRQVYQAFAFACLSSGRADDVFEALFRRSTSRSSPDWPSWVPDWRNPTSSSWPYGMKPPPKGTIGLVPYPTLYFGLHGTQFDTLSVSWDHSDTMLPLLVVDTILAWPKANSVSSMVSSLRALLVACPSTLIDSLLSGMGLGKFRYHKSDANPGVYRFENGQMTNLPFWMESETQRPRLFIANSSSPTELSLGISSADLLEGDEVALYAQLDKLIITSTENRFLIRKRSATFDSSSSKVTLHRLLGAALVARFHGVQERRFNAPSQNFTLYLS